MKYAITDSKVCFTVHPAHRKARPDDPGFYHMDQAEAFKRVCELGIDVPQRTEAEFNDHFFYHKLLKKHEAAA